MTCVPPEGGYVARSSRPSRCPSDAEVGGRGGSLAGWRGNCDHLYQLLLILGHPTTQHKALGTSVLPFPLTLPCRRLFFTLFALPLLHHQLFLLFLLKLFIIVLVFVFLDFLLLLLHTHH